MASDIITKTRSLFVFFSLILVTTLSQAAFAEIDDSIRISGSEKAVIAFFHMAEKAPDYENWIKSSAFYKATADEIKEEVLIQEWLRLDRGYGHYEINKDILEISALVIAQYSAPQEDKPARFTFSFPNRKEGITPIFSYPYGKEWVSMIIRNLNTFTNISLTEAQYERIRKVLPEDEPFHEVELIVHTRPTEADHKTPTKIYGEKSWIMVSDIAFIQCSAISHLTGKTIPLWNYIAPWYEKQYNEKQIPEELKYPHPYDIHKK